VNIPRACIVGGRGCSDGGIAVAGTSRCRAHMYKSGWGRYVVKHPERSVFYRSPAWRAMREAHLKANPSCVVCGRPASHADHVRPLAEGGALDGELQSLCQEHHRRKTLAESHRGMKRAAARRKRI
jgi:5-methylcytosine-specific restriction endonuclease McrA